MKKYLKNVLIGFDMFANTVFNGHPDETISARAGRAAAEGKLWGRLLARFLNAIQKNHVVIASQGDAKRADVVEFLETGK